MTPSVSVERWRVMTLRDGQQPGSSCIVHINMIRRELSPAGSVGAIVCSTYLPNLRPGSSMRPLRSWLGSVGKRASKGYQEYGEQEVEQGNSEKYPPARRIT
jgi:hypothetical protein